MLYEVAHSTTYAYSEPASTSSNLVHLHPRATPRQKCHVSLMEVQPEPRTLHEGLDYFDNPMAVFIISEPHNKLSIVVKHRVEVTPTESLRFHESPGWEQVRGLLKSQRAPAEREAYQFVFESHYVPPDARLAAYSEPSFAPGRPLLEAVLDLTERIHGDFHYDVNATSVATPLLEVLAHRRGVCQDFAHLQIGCLRSLGLAARYVTGYLQTKPPPGKPRLRGADVTHAWVSVFCPGVGWVDFDPTNKISPSGQHITIAWGRDYDDVSPVKGVVLGGGTPSLSTAVDVLDISDAESKQSVLDTDVTRHPSAAESQCPRQQPRPE
jgi:transglutaminase-like putative cysteine protease